MDKLLRLINNNARLTNSQISVMLNTSEEEVGKSLEQYEKSGVIRGYKAILDFEKIDADLVVAIIELKVTPKANLGFDEIGGLLMEFDEVDTVYLMSGGYDFSVVVTGRTFKDIALFVAHRLAVIDGVVSTATHFVLSKYKESGIRIRDELVDERRNTWL